MSRGCDRSAMVRLVVPVRRWKSAVLAASAMPRQVAQPVPVGLTSVVSPAAQAWAVWKGPLQVRPVSVISSSASSVYMHLSRSQ
ncbi:MAG: hypothetical protein TQ37_06845 [Candidatus Synechococcus spongiarum 15L]|uniref:Uncharacterized protein n=1 Tax=Candidatus Synechococcus spongiarum 15L TaxID=1608419 RepID=A0A0G8ATT9_9SYNE|nr:MAG: hypothetical protein TQ37_06845 [Candidatus Synechococcus spongiarum 15L]